MAQKVAGARISGEANEKNRRRRAFKRKPGWGRQRGFILNPYRYSGGGGPGPGPTATDPFYDLTEAVSSFDGTDTDTTFTDPRGGDIWTFNGGAQLDDAQTAFMDDTTSLLFDGTGDYLTTPDDPRWQLSTSDYWTVEAMIRPGNVTAIKSFVSKRNDGSTDGGFDFYVNASSKLRLLVWAGGSEVVSLTSTTSLTVDTWQHVAFVRYGTLWLIFIDGVLEDSATESGTPTENTDPLHIGRAITDSARDYDGHMAHLRITKGWSRWVHDFTAPTEAHPTSLAATGRDASLGNVAAHLTCRGLDGGTSLIDEAGVSWTMGGNCEIDDAQSPIDGQTAIRFPGSSGDSVSFADSVIPGGLADRDFTIEMWVRFNNVDASSEIFLSQYDAGTSQRSFRFQRSSSGDLNFAYSSNGTSQTFVGGTWNPVDDTWYHVAASRIGNELHLLADGVLIHTADVTGLTFHNSSTLWRLGANNNGATSELLDGWLADVRITMDEGRYDAGGYTVPDHLLPAYALFSPALVSTECWFDADDGDTITIDTGVSQWNDKSGNDRHVTQSTGSDQPTLQAAVQNGLDVIRFDGSNDYLNGSSNLSGLHQNVGALTMLCVRKFDAVPTSDERIFTITGFTAEPTFTRVTLRGGSTSSKAGFTVRRLNSDSPGTLASSANITTGFELHVGVVDHTNNDGYQYIDGGEDGSDTSFLGSGNSENSTPGALTFGAYYNPSTMATSAEFDGDIGEAIVLHSAGTAFRQIVEGYMSHRWGIDDNLASDHPHKRYWPVVSLAMIAGF